MSDNRHASPGVQVNSSRLRALLDRFALSIALVCALAMPLHAREKNAMHYGEGLIVNIPLPEREVAQVVEEVAGNTIIRGTKEYNKDEFVSGATAASSTNVFPEWTEEGKVFYKVRRQAIDPRNFKDGGDVGTLAVRYVVQVQGYQNTVLRIDSVFVEDFRRTVHQSNGSVESSEYKDIQEHLDAIELMKKQDAASREAKQERVAKDNFGLGSDKVVLSTPPASAAQTSDETANAEVPRAENGSTNLSAPSDQ